MTDHKIDMIITASEPSAKKPLSQAMQHAATASQIHVGRGAFDDHGRLSEEALEVVSEVMSRGGVVQVDLPDAARHADAFNTFASSVLNRADAKAGHRNTGQIIFAGPVDALLVTTTKPAPHRRH